MIVPMKKTTILVQSKDLEGALNTLRNTGLLHIEHQNVPVDEGITKLEAMLQDLSKSIEILPDCFVARPASLAKRAVAPRNDKVLPEELIAEILRLSEEKEVALEDLKMIKRKVEACEEWGDFDPELVDDLKNKGIVVRLCKITKKEIHNIPQGVVLETLFKKGNIFYCALISREEITLPFPVVSFPEEGLTEMRSQKTIAEDRLKQIQENFQELAQYKNILLTYKKSTSSILEFNKAYAGSGKFNTISFIRGYCPVHNVHIIEKLQKKEKWGLIIEDPEDNDNPPTLIKNPKWVELINPVFDILKTIPGYREVDISLHFLIFFSLFFGMLIGDAGYGVIYILAAMFFQWKLKNLKDKKIFFLTYLLSSVAIGWGLITGVFFGPHPWLKPLVPYFSKDVNIQSFCFLIGATQLSIAHLWKFLRKWPSLKALSDIGWIAILWTAYFLANTLILTKNFPAFAKWFFIIGAFLVILFTSPAKNILKGIGIGIGDFLLKLMNSFGDIVSYIRLFAVGTAGVAIADAFNQIAANIGAGGSIMNISSSFIVLFLGHSLNMVMGILAILVHGVRLNVLEFSGHLDMEWSGIEYAPFSVKE